MANGILYTSDRQGFGLVVDHTKHGAYRVHLERNFDRSILLALFPPNDHGLCAVTPRQLAEFYAEVITLIGDETKTEKPDSKFPMRHVIDPSNAVDRKAIKMVLQRHCARGQYPSDDIFKPRPWVDSYFTQRMTRVETQPIPVDRIFGQVVVACVRDKAAFTVPDAAEVIAGNISLLATILHNFFNYWSDAEEKEPEEPKEIIAIAGDPIYGYPQILYDDGKAPNYRPLFGAKRICNKGRVTGVILSMVNHPKSTFAHPVFRLNLCIHWDRTLPWLPFRVWFCNLKGWEEEQSAFLEYMRTMMPVELDYLNRKEHNYRYPYDEYVVEQGWAALTQN